MQIRHRALKEVIGAEVLGCDLGKPVPPALFADIKQLWLERTILLFRDQDGLTPDAQLAFSRLIGEIDPPDLPQYSLPDHPSVSVVSNVKQDGRYIGAPKAGRNWHSDSQFLSTPPSGSFLVAKEVPPADGDTLFANMYAAYEALPATTKQRIDGVKVNHSRVRAYSVYHPERPPLTDEEKTRVPDVVHPMVRTHPETGRKALYVGGAQHGGSVVGMSPDEGEALLRELRDFATQERFVYRHRWRCGDAILWDNRSTLHCALPFDEEKYRRVMYRTQMVGSRPY
jgi:alpha-ketoglutarate-dependent taurine dioxygenase